MRKQVPIIKWAFIKRPFAKFDKLLFYENINVAPASDGSSNFALDK